MRSAEIRNFPTVGRNQTARDAERTIDRMAQHLKAERADAATLRQELVRAYLQIDFLKRQLDDDGK